MSSAKGVKYDQGKRQDRLLFGGLPHSLGMVSDVLTFGAEKYTPNGWQSVQGGLERYTDALYRHLLSYHAGEENDCESGLPHIAHAITNLMFITEILYGQKSCVPAQDEGETNTVNGFGQDDSELSETELSECFFGLSEDS